MPRKFTAEFKFEVVRQIQSGERRMAQVCREHDLDPGMVRDWRETVTKKGEQAFPRSVGEVSADTPTEGHLVSELSSAQARIGDLERLVGQQALELDLLKKVCRRCKVALPRGLSS